MNEETLLNDYKSNGFLLLKNYLDQDEIFKILRECKNIFLKQFIYKKYIDYINVEDIDPLLFDKHLIKLFEEDFSTFSNCGKQVQHLIS